MSSHMLASWIAAVCLATSLGCAAKPYRYGQSHAHCDAAAAPAAIDYTFGEPDETHDHLRRLLSYPERFLDLKSERTEWDISPETAAKLDAYLTKNGLTDVRVYVNHYDPDEQWQRLRENTRVGAGWRYSLGTVSMIRYSLLPGRVFGSNRYNPYTNSLYVNSDVPAMLLHEAAFAKEMHARPLPGTYAAISELPGFAALRQAHGVSDVLGYAQAEDDWQLEEDAYHVLYPRVASNGLGAASTFVPMWWASPVLRVAGAGAGYAAGHTTAAQREVEYMAAHRATGSSVTRTANADSSTQPLSGESYRR